jgi:hypothetical protein
MAIRDELWVSGNSLELVKSAHLVLV